MKKYSYYRLICMITLAAVQLVKSYPTANRDETDGNENHHADEGNANNKNYFRFDGINKSPNNSRSYRALKLQNELNVVLIHDPKTDKGAACMTVGVGSIHDDDDLPGLAHFLEHMLFMGSEKYRQENSFEKFITEHAGDHNGSTSDNSQDYFFDIAHENLLEVLDIFSQFFVKPLMDPSCTEREVNAVDSEHSMNLPKDNWKIGQVQRSLSKPGHPYSRFKSGNLKSLDTNPKEKGINVRQKLLELYSTRYSSNLMYLAVLGRENLDKLEEMVVPLFENIQNKKLEKSIYTEHFWGPEQLKHKIYITTIADIRRLSLRFPMPSVEEHYKTAPLVYIFSLIGHEGPGSIANELKDRDWCERLYTAYEDVPGFTYFFIDIDVTKKAMDHIDEIVKLVFQYIYLLRRDGVPKWYFDELNTIRETLFKYEDQSLPLYHVQSVSEAMMHYPFEDILSYFLLHNQWNPELISEYLNYLTPENMNLFICTKSFGDIEGEILTEPWYGTKYIVEKLSDDFITKMWKITEPYDKLHLPTPNEYLTRDFSFYPLDKNESKTPRLIHESSMSQFWLKRDEESELPRMVIVLDISLPAACSIPEKAIMIDMFVSLFNKSFDKYGYDALEAALAYAVGLGNYGLQVAVFGYNEKLPRLLERIIVELINFQPDEKKFEIVKESHVRALKNVETHQPVNHGASYLNYLFSPSADHRHERLAATKSIQMHDMNKFVRKLFSRVYIQGLIYGNSDKQSAKDIIKMIETCFESATVVLPQEIESARALKMENGSNFVYEAPHKYSTSSSYSASFQIDYDYPVANIVLTDFFSEIVQEKCFNVLRTEEQLGYIVGCGAKQQNGALYFTVSVQSEKHPIYLDLRVEVFLQNLKKTLEELTEDDIKTYKESLKNRYLERKVNQWHRAVYFLDEITDRRYLFDKSNVMAGLVDPLGKENILEFFEMYIQKSASNRKKLEAHVISNLTNPELPDDVLSEMRIQKNNIKIDDANIFRSSLGTFPVPKSVIDIDTLREEF